MATRTVSATFSQLGIGHARFHLLTMLGAEELRIKRRQTLVFPALAHVGVYAGRLAIDEQRHADAADFLLAPSNRLGVHVAQYLHQPVEIDFFYLAQFRRFLEYALRPLR